MKNVKRIASIVLASVMLLMSLGACVSAGAEPTTAAATTAAASTTAATTVAASTAAGTTAATTVAASTAATTTAAASTAATTAAATAATTTATDLASDSVPLAADGPITVISREDGSGTRGAFIELFGVLGEDDVDGTLDTAEITNSTSVMMTSVAGNPEAIGYISLGSLNDTVKAATIDGAVASVENIVSGEYTISRPFVIAVKEGLGEPALDFMGFIMSTEGQDVIEENGYIRVEDTGAYGGAKPAGTIVVSGSSSVSPVMEKLIEAYQAVNTGAEIELQTSDSSAGMTNTIEGICDIGMSSRELKESELSAGLQATTIAIDGIAVIVNNESPVTNLTKDQVRGIFTGEIANWAGLN